MTLKEVLKAHKNTMAPKVEGKNNYGAAHVAALSQNFTVANGSDKGRMEQAIVKMILGCVEYADAHEALYEAKLGDDGVMGTYWLTTLKSIHALLAGETGRLQQGAISTLLRELAEVAGFTQKEWEAA